MDHIIYVGAALMGAAATAAALKLLIPVLKEYKVGQMILLEGPKWHMAKQGTPTMGGVTFGAVIPLVFTIFAAIYYFFYREGAEGISDILPAVTALIYAVACGLCGVADDLCKLKHKANNGLSAWQKYVLLLALTIGFLFAMNRLCGLSTELYIPFAGQRIQLGTWYWVFAAVLLTGTVNAVNLTDGVDGLCGSVSAVVFLSFFASSLMLSSVGTGIVSCTAFGACMGFLIFNTHPAKVFMGDTGSLFLGGLISALAFAVGSPLLLFIVGFVYMFEALSVMLQVFCFKLTKKRLFKMAPFHHHLEKCGWSEKRIVAVFTAFTALLAVICAVFDGVSAV